MYMKKILTFSLLAFAGSTFAQPSSFSSRGIGGGGALFALSINPADNNEYYVACDMGELFHTEDYGNSYDQVHFTQVIGGHNSKVCYTSTPGLLYTISYAQDMVRPMKSTDNGLTWNVLNGNPDNSEETYTIDADYTNPNRVIISYYGSIYYSDNGGNSFTNVYTDMSGSGDVLVGGVFFDGSNIYIGTSDGVFVSTNAGTSWNNVTITGIPSTERISSFAGAKSGGITRFFCITGDVGDVYPGLVGSDYWDFAKGVYSVDYGSGNWTPKLTGINLSSDFPMFVGMATNDINTVYLAGSNDNSVPTIFKTTNAGSNWNNTFNSTGNQNISTGWSGQGGDRPWSYGECPFALAIAPNDANRVIFGDFGFVHKTSNGGTSWQQAYVNTADQHPAGSNTPPAQSYQSVGIENTTCWQICWVDSSNMFSCFSDIKGVRSTDAGNSWSFNYTGHSANSMYRLTEHPTNGTLFAATSNIHDMYQSTRLQDAQLDANDPQGKIIYSTNNGQTWQLLHLFNHPVFWIALDPNNPNRAYASVIHYNGGAGVGGIYVTNDLQNLTTSTWTLLTDPPRTQKHPASIVVLNDGKMVCTYSGRRNAGGTFQNCSGTFIYDPAGAGSWTDVSDPGMYYWTKDIVIDPNDVTQNTWYVGVFSGWGGPPNGTGGLYKTTNRGISWTRLSNTAAMDRVTSCTFNPNNPNQVYMTTEVQGLWISNNMNTSTPTFTQVQSYPFQQPERVFFNPYNTNEVWVSSFGNGMKMGTLNPIGIPEFENTAANDLVVYPNPAGNELCISMKSDALKNASIEIKDILGKTVLKQALGSDTKIDISTLENGTYFVSVSSNGMVKTKKVIVTK
jgi:photosystem II stability/assembly factor-like uncharacterized protein